MSVLYLMPFNDFSLPLCKPTLLNALAYLSNLTSTSYSVQALNKPYLKKNFFFAPEPSYIFFSQ